MSRVPALAVLAITSTVVAGCGHSGGHKTGTYAQIPGLVVTAPVITASPDVFVMGLPSTQELSAGQRVKLFVGGPALRSAIPGQATQFAPNLRLTFTITASLASGPPVTLAPADFAVHRAMETDTPVAGPAETLSSNTPRTWQVTSIQTPGQGDLVWHEGTKTIASWSYVAEND